MQAADAALAEAAMMGRLLAVVRAKQERIAEGEARCSELEEQVSTFDDDREEGGGAELSRKKGLIH